MTALISSSTDEQEVVKNKISGAINRQHARYHTPYVSNSSLSSAETAKFIHLAPSAESLLRSAAEHLELSARSFFKTIKVAQTIADYENQDVIQPEHISEALSYRLDQTKDSFIISGKPKKTLAMSPKI